MVEVVEVKVKVKVKVKVVDDNGSNGRMSAPEIGRDFLLSGT